MPESAPTTTVSHLKLLSCARGHFWESAIAEDGSCRQAVCPTCGAPPDELPLLDLEPNDFPLPPVIPTPLPPPYQDKGGKPVVADYDVLEDLGRATGGVVQHRAKQIVLNRVVVLKTVLARDDPSQHAWGTLRGEAAALAKLPHPNIVTIFEAGDRDRQLFYNAVELVEGPTLAALIADKPLPVPQALILVEVLARAVHFAHEKGMIHRGLRPQMVLLQVQRTDKKETDTPEPPACSVHAVLCIPKITGFGLAKSRLVEGDVTDQELQDRFPCYLSPEQAWGRSKEIGPATDVYALGAILYECLTGKPPFKGSSPGTTLEQIQTIDPLPIDDLRKGVPPDVKAIVARCLHKQPRRRYASARELADDLHRAVEGRPVQARPPNFIVRFAKWSRRNPLAFVALAAVVLGLLGTYWAWSAGNVRIAEAERETNQAIRARQEAERLRSTLEREGETARQRANRAEYFQRIARAERELERDNFVRVQEILGTCSPELRHLEWHLLMARTAGPAWHRELPVSLPVSSLAWSQDGQFLAASTSNAPLGRNGTGGALHNWRTVDFIPQFGPLNTVPTAWQVAFSPDGQRLACLSGQGLKVVDKTGGAEVEAFPGAKPRVPLATAFCYSPDGALILLGTRNGVERYNTLTGAREFDVGDQRFDNVGEATDRLLCLDVSGKRYASVRNGARGLVRIYSEISRPFSHLQNDSDVTAMATCPQSGSLATGASDGAIRLWTEPSISAQNRKVLQGHVGQVNVVVFSPDGQRLVSGGKDGTIRVWDVESGNELLTLRNWPGRPGLLSALAVGPKGHRLAVGADQKVLVLGAGVE